LCMAMPALTAEDAHEQALQFVPCEAAPAESTLFSRWRDNGDGRYQISGSNFLCIDAKSGGGPIAYLCHPLDSADPNQLFEVSKAGAPMGWNGTMVGALLDYCLDVEDIGGDPVSLATCTLGKEIDELVEVRDNSDAEQQRPRRDKVLCSTSIATGTRASRFRRLLRGRALADALL